MVYQKTIFQRVEVKKNLFLKKLWLDFSNVYDFRTEFEPKETHMFYKTKSDTQALQLAASSRAFAMFP